MNTLWKRFGFDKLFSILVCHSSMLLHLQIAFCFAFYFDLPYVSFLETSYFFHCFLITLRKNVFSREIDVFIELLRNDARIFLILTNFKLLSVEWRIMKRVSDHIVHFTMNPNFSFVFFNYNTQIPRCFQFSVQLKCETEIAIFILKLFFSSFSIKWLKIGATKWINLKSFASSNM